MNIMKRLIEGIISFKKNNSFCRDTEESTYSKQILKLVAYLFRRTYVLKALLWQQTIPWEWHSEPQT